MTAIDRHHISDDAPAHGRRQGFAAELVSSRWLRCFVALSLLFLGTWLLNQFIFPRIAVVYGMARELATVSSSCAALAVALTATLRPAWLRPRPLALGATAVMLAGFALVQAGLALASPALITAGAVVMNAGRATIMAVSCIVLIGLSARSSALCIAGSLALAYAWRGIFVALPEPLGMLAYPAVTLGAFALVWPFVREQLDRTRTRPSAATLALTEPRSFLPFAHVLFLAFFVFRSAYGFSLTFGAVESTPPFSLLPLIPLALVALQVVATGRAAPGDILYQVACLFVLAGFLATLVPQTVDSAVPNMLLAAGGNCFSVLMYYTLAAVGRRNPLHALSMFAWGQCATSAGSLVGTSLGHLMNGLLANDAALVPATVAVVVLAFAALNLTVLRSFSFERTIEGVEAVPEVAAAPQDEPRAATAAADDEAQAHALDQQCARLAQEYALTEREGEVFRLLARGRNVPFIEEELIISRNTIKTHIKHIYQKMDLHSQQELIDLAETY